MNTEQQLTESTVIEQFLEVRKVAVKVSGVLDYTASDDFQTDPQVMERIMTKQFILGGIHSWNEYEKIEEVSWNLK